MGEAVRPMAGQSRWRRMVVQLAAYTQKPESAIKRQS